MKGNTMWNTPTEDQLSKIPRLYETEHIPAEEKLIYLHFFIGDCDWFIAELMVPKDRDDTVSPIRSKTVCIRRDGKYGYESGPDDHDPCGVGNRPQQ